MTFSSGFLILLLPLCYNQAFPTDERRSGNYFKIFLSGFLIFLLRFCLEQVEQAFPTDKRRSGNNF
jgi:hypothetical protein